MPEVTNTELAILEFLWSCTEPVPIAEITEALYGQRTASDHATVQSLLARLEAKGCVRRERAGRAHLYAAVIARGELIDHQLRTLADKLCEGSLTPLLTHLIRTRKLKAKERQELRELLAGLEEEAPPSTTKAGNASEMKTPRSRSAKPTPRRHD